MDAGYLRYEISNFSLLSRSSIHNRVYREMEEYLGLGLGASSFLREKASTDSQHEKRIRYQNTSYLPKYLKEEFSPIIIEEMPVSFEQGRIQEGKDFLIEKFFLALRTERGVQDLSAYSSIVVPNYTEKIKLMETQDLVITNGEKLQLTDKGMDCYNRIVTELLQEI